MRFWHINMISLNIKQGHFETATLILHNFFVVYYGLRITFNYLFDSNTEYSDPAV